MNTQLTIILAGLGVFAVVAILGGIYAIRDSRRAHIQVVYGDITDQRVDAIVNAAKSSLLGGGGVDGAIHKAGGPAILRQCRALRAMQYPNGLPVGQAVATVAGDLNADWVIHTVGPMYDKHAEGGLAEQAATLRSCYVQALALADKLHARSVAFPLISAGVYGWPVGDAVRQALAALAGTKTNVETVRLVLFDEAAFDMALAALQSLSKH